MTAPLCRPSRTPAVAVSISSDAGGNRDGGLALRGGVSAVRGGFDGGNSGASSPPPRAPGITLLGPRFNDVINGKCGFNGVL